MKMNLFRPESKIHAQRNIMREIDERLASYSRRGLLLSLTTFVICLLVGDFYNSSPKLALVLVGGLLLITLARGYFLLRFERYYSQAPNRWRNIFFTISLLGASWWGLCVASVTWVNGLNYETPVLWLYTVTFFAGSLYGFAPFSRFFTLYMSTSFIPCSLVAISFLDPVSILFGCMMIVLYFLLSQQGRMVGNNYWDRQQVNYDLIQRANTLEAEKMTTESSLSSRDQFFNRLTLEVKSAMHELSDSLQLLKDSSDVKEKSKLFSLLDQKIQQQRYLLKNIIEHNNISKNNLHLDAHTVDLRNQIEESLSNISSIPHKKNIELYSSFANDIPLRARVDADRLDQLVANLISSACHFCNESELFVDITHQFDNSTDELFISVVNKNPIISPETIEHIDDIFSPERVKDIYLALSLSIIKNLTQLMQGEAGVSYEDDNSLIFWAKISLSSVASTINSFQPSSKMSGKKIMLYQPPKGIAEVFVNTLESLELRTTVMNDSVEALKKLNDDSDNDPYHLVIVYTRLNDVSALEFSQAITSVLTLKYLSQIIIISHLQSVSPTITRYLSEHSNVHTLDKPIQFRRLQKLIKHTVKDPEKITSEKNNDDFLAGKRILLFQREDIDATIVKAMLVKLNCDVITASSIDESLDILSKQAVDAFISETRLQGFDLKNIIVKAKELNLPLHTLNYKIPVLGYSNHETVGEESHCLASGMEYYIDSPTNEDDLRAILRRFIGRAVYLAENF